MRARDWEVTITRKADGTKIGVIPVVAPNWLAAETIATLDVAKRLGGKDDDYEADAEPSFTK